MHMRSFHPAAQPGGVRHEMHILPPQPGQLTAPQSHPPQRQHDEPVPPVPARPQQLQNLLIANGLDRALGLPQPVPGPQPRLDQALATRLRRQGPVIGHLEQRPQRSRVGQPGRDSVPEELPHRCQHAVDPALTAHRPGQIRRAGPGRIVITQPVHEPAQSPRSPLPLQPGRLAPVEQQRQRDRIRLRARLGQVAPQPHMQQEPVRRLVDPPGPVHHRPVPDSRRQPHRERTVPLHPALTPDRTQMTRNVTEQLPEWVHDTPT